MLQSAIAPSFQLRIAIRLKHWILNFLSFKTICVLTQKYDEKSWKNWATKDLKSRISKNLSFPLKHHRNSWKKLQEAFFSLFQQGNVHKYFLILRIAYILSIGYKERLKKKLQQNPILQRFGVYEQKSYASYEDYNPSRKIK